MVVPAIVLLLVFNYVPLFGLVTAFQDYDPLVGVWHSDWVGFDQFRQLFADPLFWGSLKNTLYLSFVQLVLFFPIPIALALLLNSVLSPNGCATSSSRSSTCRTSSPGCWPSRSSSRCSAVPARSTSSCAATTSSTWDIMTNPHTFALLVTSQAIWKEAGWGIIVFLAALAAINTDLYEAAAADGAGPFRRMWHITLPGLRGVIMLMLVLRLGNALTVGFEQFLVQRSAVGHNAADVLDTFSFYYGIATGNYSYGAAAGLFKSAISLVLIWGANRLAHAFGEDGLYRK